MTAAPRFLYSIDASGIGLAFAPCCNYTEDAGPDPRWRDACDRDVFAETGLPAGRAGMESDSSPWETPGRQRLAGGRPQLTAGIRAGSYAFKCSNVRFPASMQRFGRNGRRLERMLQLLCRMLANRLDLGLRSDGRHTTVFEN